MPTPWLQLDPETELTRRQARRRTWWTVQRVALWTLALLVTAGLVWLWMGR